MLFKKSKQQFKASPERFFFFTVLIFPRSWDMMKQCWVPLNKFISVSLTHCIH